MRHNWTKDADVSLRRDIEVLAAAVLALALVVGAFLTFRVEDPLIVGFTFLLLVLPSAAMARLWVPATVSVLSTMAFNFFFLAPVGSFYLQDPQNWVALFAFLAVSLVASNLSTAARARAREAVQRQEELTRLFDVSRDVLLTSEGSEALGELARFVARRFGFDFAAVCLRRAGQWDVHPAGPQPMADTASLVLALDRCAAPGFERTSPPIEGHHTIEVEGRLLQLVPLRPGSLEAGFLAVGGRPIDPHMLDALAGVATIAIERAHLLEERNAAELTRKSEELKSALLASIAHDLRTPLTAIRVAASNLQAPWLQDDDRREQSDLVLAEVDRLQTLFQNILEMARIDTGGVAAEAQWVHPSEIVEAARSQVQPALEHRSVEVLIEPDLMVQVDPRLTASALARVLENAAQYSPPDTAITVNARVSADGLTLTVRDLGPGIGSSDLPHLFDRFYRGRESRRRAVGIGMGLSIARGLLAAERGRIDVENCSDRGAQFTLVVPAESRRPISGETDA
jgi:two-component system sensor histidine kinase KdpD